MAHEIAYYNLGHDQHIYKCRCGAVCERKATLHMAEDEATKHLNQVERLRKPRTVTLEAEHQHALTMSTDPNVSTSDRALWKQMAAELGRRLGLEAPPSKQEELFTL